MPSVEIYKPVLGFVRAELIVNCAIVFIVLVVVSLRVLGRIAGPGLGWDDGLVILATVCPPAKDCFRYLVVDKPT